MTSVPLQCRQAAMSNPSQFEFEAYLGLRILERRAQTRYLEQEALEALRAITQAWCELQEAFIDYIEHKEPPFFGSRASGPRRGGHMRFGLGKMVSRSQPFFRFISLPLFLKILQSGAAHAATICWCSKSFGDPMLAFYMSLIGG